MNAIKSKEMPIDPSIYQYCEAQDIPLEYLDEYEKETRPKQFEWKNLFWILIVLLALPLIIIFLSGYLIITFGRHFS